MSSLRIFLVASTIIIYVSTAYAISAQGVNWPRIYFGDILGLDWRSQFNTDFLIHLFLFATWICWRERFTTRGYVFGFLSIFMGGMFGFPYLLVAAVQAKGDPKLILLGDHA